MASNYFLLEVIFREWVTEELLQKTEMFGIDFLFFLPVLGWKHEFSKMLHQFCK